MSAPQPAAGSFELLDGAVALPGGLLWLSRANSLVAADVHFGYEDVIGGALPLWSTTETTQTLLLAARRMQAREIVFLGDIIHSSRMSEGAAKAVNDALTFLRRECTVTLVAGNHEGRTRGEAILGETEEAVERDGWLLLHGDEPLRGRRCIVGHLHPSLPLDARQSVPVFLAAPHLIVVPALTPYSNGLNALSSDCTEALREFGETKDFIVVASTHDRVYPFGKRRRLQGVMSGGAERHSRTVSMRHRLQRDPSE
ncbi:MAG: hypothetical protein JO322_12905 [Candidatus Eremiobacteraeota bacterium]|nr:hypothetical protein [Candidatus Eremiobacteraeota bacterium]